MITFVILSFYSLCLAWSIYQWGHNSGKDTGFDDGFLKGKVHVFNILKEDPIIVIEDGTIQFLPRHKHHQPVILGEEHGVSFGKTKTKESKTRRISSSRNKRVKKDKQKSTTRNRKTSKRTRV